LAQRTRCRQAGKTGADDQHPAGAALCARRGAASRKASDRSRKYGHKRAAVNFAGPLIHLLAFPPTLEQ
jgi:hypothetical protein